MSRDAEARLRSLEEEVGGNHGSFAEISRRIEELESQVAAQASVLKEFTALAVRMTSLLEQRFGSPEREAPLPNGHCGDPLCDFADCEASPVAAQVGGGS